MLLASREIPVEVHGHGRFVDRRSDFLPAYLRTYEEGRLRDKVEDALEALGDCTLCPRDCHVNRLDNRFAVCKTGRYARVSSFFPHFGEEDVLRGWRGSGTIFFAWCNLRCQFCQNFETSQIGEGEDLSPKQLAAMMLHLQQIGCHNINFVTPEHVVPQILEALPYAIEGGLRLPLVYNTSAYDSLHSIALMDGVVDVYMPDFKLWHREHARKYLLAPNYPDVAREVIRAMHEQVGPLRVDEDGLALRGLIVRHLVMPGLLDDTREILNWIAGLSVDTYVNVMDQYYPAWKAKTEPKLAQINRRLYPQEFEQALRFARQAGLWRLDARWRRLDRVLWA
ncbi:MAG: radical SAM protein [Armatimonadota bacterium]|nr:radical SAM protein [Armatimonadota bacterium]MDR5697275.1 radical SAM protein [Armatimonadota bacterium]